MQLIVASFRLTYSDPDTRRDSFAFGRVHAATHAGWGVVGWLRPLTAGYLPAPVWRSRTSSGPERRRLAVHVKRLAVHGEG